MEQGYLLCAIPITRAVCVSFPFLVQLSYIKNVNLIAFRSLFSTGMVIFIPCSYEFPLPRDGSIPRDFTKAMVKIQTTKQLIILTKCDKKTKTLDDLLGGDEKRKYGNIRSIAQ